MLSEFQVDTETVSLRGRRGGRGPGLLLVHGGGVDSGYFTEAADRLANSFTVIAYDRRGYGGSSHPTDGDHSVAVQVTDALNVLGAATGPCHVVAHSLGAALAVELAALHPDMVETLVLHEPPPFEDPLIGSPRMRSLVELAAAGRRAAAMATLLADLGPQDPRALGLTDEDPDRVDRNIDTFLTADLPALIDADGRRAMTPCWRAAVGIGELSRSTPRLADARSWSERLHCSLVAFPGGHNCPADLPREFAAMITGLILGGGL